MRNSHSHSNDLVRYAKRFQIENDGGVAIILAIALPIILGTGALALDGASAFLAQKQNQRAADLAAYAAALEFKQATGSPEQKQEKAELAAQNIVQRNGLSAVPGVSATDDYVEVTIQFASRTGLGRLLRSDSQIGGRVLAKVDLSSGGPSLSSCFHSLNDFTITGAGNGNNTDISVECEISANATMKVAGKPGTIEKCGAAGGFTANGCGDEIMISEKSNIFPELINDVCSGNSKPLSEWVETGPREENGQVIYDLPPGEILCVDSIWPANEVESNSGNRGNRGNRGNNESFTGCSSPWEICAGVVFRSTDQGTNLIVFTNDNTNEIVVGRNAGLVINAYDTYNGHEGLALYAPTTKLSMSKGDSQSAGESGLNLSDLGCFGAVVEGYDDRGGSKLRLSGTCTEPNVTTDGGKLRFIE